jgi:hypothetical protein
MFIHSDYRLTKLHYRYLTGKIMITILYAKPDVISKSCVIHSILLVTMNRYTLRYTTVKKIKKLTKMREDV